MMIWLVVATSVAVGTFVGSAPIWLVMWIQHWQARRAAERESVLEAEWAERCGNNSVEITVDAPQAEYMRDIREVLPGGLPPNREWDHLKEGRPLGYLQQHLTKGLKRREIEEAVSLLNARLSEFTSGEA